MNISLAAHAAAGATGAAGKSGKSGDPLADFMALLDQLGITVEADGSLPATAGPTTPGAQDIAAKLLARLGKKGAETLSQPKADIPASENGTDEPKQDDPVVTLTNLLAEIEPAAAKGAEPVKPDIATLIAAVRAFVSSEAKPIDGTATDPADPKAPPVASALAPTSAPSIAALLARTSRAAGGEKPKPVAPGAVQTAFVRLEALVSDKPAAGKPTEGKPTTAQAAGYQPVTVDVADAKPPVDSAKDQVPEKKDSATPTSVADQTTAGEQTGPVDKGGPAARLGELLARLTASVKPGAGQPQAASNAAAPAHAARPQVDPQVAALVQASQNVTQDDRPASETADIFSGTTLGLSAIAASSAPARADAVPADMAPANQAEELVNHHLDLARDTQWLDTLARDIARAAQSDTQLRFQLNPEHLGSLKVELLNGANGTSVKLTADTEAARAILADAQPRLVAEARAQGLRISEAQVDLGGHGGGHRPTAEAPVVIRTANGAALAEIEQDKPAASGERYA